MDKELIAMCECPAIQDKWETEKLGDSVFLSSNNSMHIVSEIKSLDVETVGIKLSGLDGFFDPFYHDDLVYIPSVETVLGWVEEEGTLEIYTDKYGSKVKNAHEWHADTMLKALIKAFIWIETHSEWDGKAWK